MLREEFGLSRLPSETKTKMLQMIKGGNSLNKIARETGLPKTTIYYYSKKINGKKYFEPKFNLEYSEAEGEIAGIFAGDGSQYYEPKRCSYQVNVHFGKTDYASYVKKLFEYYFNKKFRLQKESKGRSRLRTNSKKIFHHFKNYLQYDSKIKHSTVRLKALTFPKSFLVGFLRGFLDTDGTIYKRPNGSIRIAYSTTSKTLANQLVKILELFGIKCGYCVAKSSRFKDLHRVYILKGSNELFLKLVKPFKMKRFGPLV